MSEMRKLNDVERKLVKKNIEYLEGELEYTNILVKQGLLSLESAPVYYKKQLKEIENKLKDSQNSVKEIESTIIELTRQLKDGVEIKGETSATE